MTAALARARALLDTPPTPPVPGQLDLTRSDHMTERPATTVARWNKAHPVGTPVIAFPGCRPEDDPAAEHLTTRTRSAASVLGGHTAVVWVEGHGACIALSHVDPDHSARFPALAVACPACGSPIGRLCTSHSGTRTRRNDVHQQRTAAHAAIADCVTWLVTPETISAVDDAVDSYGVYAKGFFEEVDGRITVVGLRVGTGPDRVVARFGDTLVRHPDGRWSVRPTTP